MDIVQQLRAFNLAKRQTKLTLIYDDDKQLSQNPFTHQLFQSLKQSFQLNLIRVEQLLANPSSLGGEEIVLVISRLRNWHRLFAVQSMLADRSNLFLYDQDPWEGYHDSANCKGIYAVTNEKLKPAGFFVTSPWWADYMRKTDNLPVNFVRMGVLPKYCKLGLKYADRPHKIGFQGTVHKHRMEFYNRIRRQGFEIDILPRKPFFSFLNEVQKIGIFIYSDSGALSLNGTKQPIHGLWGKCLTVASRGCFVVRNHDLAYQGYGIDELPSVYTFKDEQEIPDILNSILSRSNEQNHSLLLETIAVIRERDDWQDISRQLNQTIGGPR